MQRWVMSEYYRDDEHNMLVPIAAAYVNTWRAPQLPTTDTGSALTEVLCEVQQLQAMREDPRIVICPPLMSTTALAPEIIAAYADKGAIAGMNLSTLLDVLSDSEPTYLLEWEPDKF